MAREDSTAFAPVHQIARAIIILRGQRVMLDSDLAALYGVTTKRFNEQVKRNTNRFPSDFMFQLKVDERLEVAICDLKCRTWRAPACAVCLYRARRHHGSERSQ